MLAFVEDEDSLCPTWLRREYLQSLDQSSSSCEQQDELATTDGGGGAGGSSNTSSHQEEDLLSLVGSQEVVDSVLQRSDNSTAPAPAADSHIHTDRLLLESRGVDIPQLLSSLKRDIQQQQPAVAPPAPLINPSSLNEGQRMAFNLIMHHQENNIVECYDIDGAAGSGKSYFVRCTQQQLNLRHGEGYCRIAAPTGTAATLFEGGVTLHSLLKLPLTGPLKKLSRAEVAKLQSPSELGRLRVLIIDEKGQVSLIILGMVDQRLREIFPNSRLEAFGGVTIILSGMFECLYVCVYYLNFDNNVVFKGDHHQLPPVSELPLYNNTDKLDDELVNKGRHVYPRFDKYTFQFREQMRQAGDAVRFSEQVARLAVAGLTVPDWYEWKVQSYSGMDPTRQAAFNDALLLATKNDSLVEYNRSRMAAVGNPMHRIVATNIPPAAAEATSDVARGLSNTLDVCNGGRVILTRNLWTSMGLVNGSCGNVAYIVFKENTTTPRLPDAIIVQFDHYRGPSCLQSEERMVAITPETGRWREGNNGGQRMFTRRMFPLQPAFGLTIHRSQGMTLDKVLLDLGM